MEFSKRELRVLLQALYRYRSDVSGGTQSERHKFEAVTGVIDKIEGEIGPIKAKHTVFDRMMSESLAVLKKASPKSSAKKKTSRKASPQKRSAKKASAKKKSTTGTAKRASAKKASTNKRAAKKKVSGKKAVPKSTTAKKAKSKGRSGTSKNA